MSDNKKMSVAEILAAARKADGGEDDAPPAESPAAEESAPVEAAKPAAKSGPPKKIAKPGSSDRPSVKDIMAMARAGDSGGGEAAKPAAKKQASEKPAAKKAAAKKPAAAAKPTEPRDTASILAAARKSTKAGPVSKAEAAAKAKSSPKKAKPKIVVPPMPVKPAYAQGKPFASPKSKAEPDDSRRNFMAIGFGMLAAATTVMTLATVKFMFPNVLREPPSKFKVGLPDAFPAGQVATKYKAQYAAWVVNTEYNGQQQIYALKSVCTHLGCTPNWLEAEQKFKCPCHGSGFYLDGINFEGPAPRPLERFAIRVAADGQIEIDKSRLFLEEKGEWSDPASYIPV